MTAALPFFVYGTLRPGERNHGLFLAGRTTRERPATLHGALLYEGPGYPYAVADPSGTGSVTGTVVTAAPEEYAALLRTLDGLEEYLAPGHPRNLYERLAREVVGEDGSPLRAWVYVAAAGVARELAADGVLIAGGDWSGRTRRPARGTGSAVRAPRSRAVGAG
ncbi:gamma-glutamylcyclotransferase family protein [Streptomyces sp. t39]|uniref:gamma-glutamylcyclotransferase family protein n=1 Tax=Streptomyces sp. t39 TaxID=1828156 RepID=UPI00164F2EC1|nr:gamma-glutamylcyclotransferase family protein [Streptomyces sp. t39]